MNKTSIAKAIDTVVNNGISVNTDDDLNLLANNEHTWDELNSLKDTVASSVMEFTTQVAELTLNQQITENLGDRTEMFKKLSHQFFSDINNFSLQVKQLRSQHEGRTGNVTSMDDYNLYNRLSLSYASLMTELSAVVSPTMGEMVMIVADIEHELRGKENAQNPNTVTDVKEKKESGNAN